MKVAVLSDIHGNHIALKKCMEEIEKRDIRNIIFLGDYVGELAYPRKVMKMLRGIMQDYECIFVRGNKEDYWLNHKMGDCSDWKENTSTTGMLYYAYKNLTEDDLMFYESLPYVQTIRFSNLPVIEAYHGSNTRQGKRLESGADNSKIFFEDTDADIILYGHTHLRKEVRKEGRMLLNPGAVGMPLQSGGKSQFVILTGENHRWNHEFIDLEYDTEAVIRELHEENLYEMAPCWTRITEHVLRHGTICHREVLERAWQLCYKETDTWGAPELPERYFEQAVKECLGRSV